MFGLTSREWYIFGIGAAIQGAFVGAILHSALILGINLLCLAWDLYMLGKTGSPE